MDKKKLKIAIDGPSASGKGTLAKALADYYGLIYMDTGALYRAVGLYAFMNNADPYNCSEIESLLPFISIELALDENNIQRVYLGGEDVSEKIRRNEISKYASAVSAHSPVRKFLYAFQRTAADRGGVVMDGRDIGTVIMPDADIKIFLTASDKARAYRRWEELTGKGQDISFEKVYSDMRERDKNDSSREAAPAIAAEDAFILNNEAFSPQQTLETAVKIISGRYGNVC